MSRVLGLKELRQLPAGFRERFSNRTVNASDVDALSEIGIKLRDIISIRSERRPAIARDERVRQEVVVKPRDRFEAQLIEYFKKQDFVTGYRNWPLRFRQMAVLGHKSNHQRFLLSMFYLLIGLDPRLLSSWVLARSVVNRGRHPSHGYELVNGDYDNNAYKQIETIVAKVKDDPGFLRRYEKILGISRIRRQV